MIAYSRMAHWDDDWVVIAEEQFAEFGERPHHVCVQFCTRPRKFLKQRVEPRPDDMTSRERELEVA